MTWMNAERVKPKGNPVEVTAFRAADPQAMIRTDLW